MSEQTSVILIHDNYTTGPRLNKALIKQGFNVHFFELGEDFFPVWEEGQNDIYRAQTILIHKDVGEGGEMTSADIVSKLRGDDLGGSRLRTILCSGEYLYAGVRDESMKVIQADAGYDPTRPGNEPLYVPQWVSEFIRLGSVSLAEAAMFRGRELVESENQLLARRAWIEGNSRSPEVG